MTELSVLIPSRCEMFLNLTVESLLAAIQGDTEIIVVLDGQWPTEPVPDHDRVTLVYHPESVGQRAATNEAARLARGKYVMKTDAHCDFDEGFDVKMMADMQDDWCMVPIMRNLHVFDWVCSNCGDRRYQGHTPVDCPKCDNTADFERDIVWIAKTNPQSTSYCFDPEPHFQYFREFKKRPEGKGDITETMSLQGSCWMMTRDKYFELNVCDEAFGSWGSQGIEVSAKFWLSGGRVVVNHKTYYAHCFRTKGGSWGFPYPLSGKQTSHAKKYARELFFENKWPQQIRPLSWLVEKFWPVRGWTDEDLARIKKFDAAMSGWEDKTKDENMLAEGPSVHEVVQPDDSAPSVQAVREVRPSEGRAPGNRALGMEEGLSKGIVYYTDNRLDPLVMQACQSQALRAGLPIVSVSLKPLDFGQNIVVEGERGPLTMFRQILAGLEAMDAQLVFLAEHDIIYHKNHWEFQPPREDLFYYNNNLWKVDLETGKALFHYSNHTSQLCAFRSLLLEHYRKRVAMVEADGFSNRVGYEPGTNRRKERIDDYWHETWMSEVPNIDIRHGKNLTRSRWRKDQFRNQRFTKGWTEADEVPGWGRTRGRFKKLLLELSGDDA